MQGEFTVGDKVYFGRKNGEKTLGEIIKVNRKTYKIRQLESRGMYRDHAVGTRWTVAKSLVWAATDERPEQITSKPKDSHHKKAAKYFRNDYPRRACLVNILTGKRTYGRMVNNADEEDAECELMYGMLANF